MTKGDSSDRGQASQQGEPTHKGSETEALIETCRRREGLLGSLFFPFLVCSAICLLLMVFGVFLPFALVFFIGTPILGGFWGHSRTKTFRANLNAALGTTSPDEIYADELHGIAVHKASGLIAIVDRATSRPFPITSTYVQSRVEARDLTDCSLVLNDELEAKRQRAPGIAGTIVGGLMDGPVGAVVGGMLTSERQEYSVRLITSVKLRLALSGPMPQTRDFWFITGARTEVRSSLRAPNTGPPLRFTKPYWF